MNKTPELKIELLESPLNTVQKIDLITADRKAIQAALIIMSNHDIVTKQVFDYLSARTMYLLRMETAELLRKELQKEQNVPTEVNAGSMDGHGYYLTPGFEALDSQLGLLKRDMGK